MLLRDEVSQGKFDKKVGFVKVNGEEFICSNCETLLYYGWKPENYNYCPFCGCEFAIDIPTDK